MHGRQNLVVYLGLNPNASMEAHALSVLGNHVLLIGPQKHRGHVYVGHRNFDLSQESDISAFAHSLGLPEAQAAALTAALRAAGIAGRDSLARLAQVWAHAEKTGALPARFVMSGHHVPGMFYGTRGGGVLSAEDIKSISVVFPRAAGAVDDLYFSACNTAAEIADWTPIFPNLRTAWAYLGTAPSLSTGAAAHIRLTEQAHARTQAEAFAKSQKTVASKARAKVERVQSELKSTEDALSAKVKGLIGDAPGKTLEDRVGAAIKAADRLRDSHDNLEKTAREAREKAADAANELEKLKTARAGRIAKLEAETRQIAEKRGDIDQLRRRLTQLVSTDDVAGELERTALQIGKLENDHKNADKDHGKAVAAREKADVIFQEMSKQSRQSRARADTDAKALRTDLKRAEFDDEAAARAAIVASSEQKRIERRISVFEGDLSATESTIAALDEALGGKLVAEAAFLDEQSVVELQEEQYERSSRAEEALRTELKEMEARHDTARELASRLDTNRKRLDRVADDSRASGTWYWRRTSSLDVEPVSTSPSSAIEISDVPVPAAASRIPSLPKAMAHAEAHVRIAPGDAWRAAEGDPGAAGARHDRDDDALRPPLAARPARRREAARSRRPFGQRVGKNRETVSK